MIHALLDRPPRERPNLGRFALVCALACAWGVALATPASIAKSAASGAMPSASNAEARAEWSRLSAAQRQALAPLAASWGSINEAQRRKWIALSSNFAQLPPAEQSKLQGRMSEWAALSPQQRTQARLNFGETRSVSPDEKRAKWEAYQALPDEERKRLAAGAVKPPPTAPAVKPAASQRLATIPVPPGDARAARIAPPGSQWRQQSASAPASAAPAASKAP